MLAQKTLRAFQRVGAGRNVRSIAPCSSTLTRSYSSSSRGSSMSPRNFGPIWVVPQQSVCVVESWGEFSRVLNPGFHLLIPAMEQVSYVHSLKEDAIPIPDQTAITMDNVTISIDGVLYLRVVDPIKASYGIQDLYYSMTQLAQTTMRSELGKMTLDKTFAERESLNHNIVKSINAAAEAWGVECLRYEIRDISPPASVKHAMDAQAEAERRKRATILDSEGARQAEINVASGLTQAIVLKAKGDAEAEILRAKAVSQALDTLGSTLNSAGGRSAVNMRITEKYIEAFAKLAKKSNTLMLPSNTGDPSAMVAQMMGIFQKLNSDSPAPSGSSKSKSKSRSRSDPLDILKGEASEDDYGLSNTIGDDENDDDDDDDEYDDEYENGDENLTDDKSFSSMKNDDAPLR